MVRGGKWPRDIIKAMENIYDLIIIGGGPAGLTAAIYARRANLNVLIIDDSASNKLSKIASIENYPGFSSISGFDLDQSFKKQVKELNIETVDEKVINIKGKDIETNRSSYKANAVLISTGSKQRKLDIPNALQYEGKGISYCATCDGFFYRGKSIAVIGNNYQALEEALYLANLVSKLTIINKSPEIKDNDTLLQQIKANSKIEIINDSIPESLITNDNKIVGMKIKNINTGEEKNIDCVGIFPYISFNPSTNFVDESILDDKGYIKTNSDMSTSIPGIFAAGDCIEKDLRQIVTACADGAIAATSIIKYLKNKA